jgi:hypothetical protein
MTYELRRFCHRYFGCALLRSCWLCLFEIGCPIQELRRQVSTKFNRFLIDDRVPLERTASVTETNLLFNVVALGYPIENLQAPRNLSMTDVSPAPTATTCAGPLGLVKLCPQVSISLPHPLALRLSGSRSHGLVRIPTKPDTWVSRF